MATRKPLVLVSGQVQELPAGDAVPVTAHAHAIEDVAGLVAVLDAKEPKLGFKISVAQTAPASPAVGDVWIQW